MLEMRFEIEIEKIKAITTVTRPGNQNFILHVIGGCDKKYRYQRRNELYAIVALIQKETLSLKLDIREVFKGDENYFTNRTSFEAG